MFENLLGVDEIASKESSTSLNGVKSDSIDNKDDLLSELINKTNPNDYVSYKDIFPLEKEASSSKFIVSDKLILKAWKNTRNFHSRLIDYNEDVVILECVVNEEPLVHEERVFDASLFSEFALSIGQFFYLSIYRKNSDVKLEIREREGLVNPNLFPKIEFKKSFSNSKIFKNKKI